MDRPLFLLLAGPNGSGKSTLASVIPLDGLAEKIDPDRMQGADGALLPPLAAGREVIARTDAHIAAGRSFLLETTLSGNREVRLIERLRVMKGGHDVLVEDILRRYERSLANLRAILPITDRALLFDNSGNGHRVVPRYENGALEWRAKDGPGWLSRVE